MRKPNLKLLVGNTDGNKVQDASIPIQWCFDEGFRSKVENLPDPHILIVVVAEGGATGGQEMYRALRPLCEMMWYVPFHRPGKNTIFATIVWNAWGRRDKLRDLFEGRSNGCFHTDVVGHNGRLLDNIGVGYAEQEVIVPKGLFGKKPPEWEQKWINLITGKFFGKAKDHCSYWRRRLFAWTVQIPLVAVFVFWFMFTRWTIAAIRLLCGFRVAWQPLVRPWKFNTNHIWEMAKEGNVFLPKVGQDAYRERCYNYYPVAEIAENIADKKGKVDHPPYTVASFFKLRGGGKNVTTPFFIPFIPALWLGVFTVIFVLNTYLFKPEHVFSANMAEMLWQTVLYGIAIPMLAIIMLPIAIQALILVAFAIIFPADFLFSKLIPKAKVKIVTDLNSLKGDTVGKLEKKRAREQAQRALERLGQQKLERELSLLTCDFVKENTPQVSVAALPREKQSVRLRFQELKSKTCRSYAQ
ncbi:MAG: hypothetical protein AAB453_01455 [Patescibacteria group bacterium]